MNELGLWWFLKSDEWNKYQKHKHQKHSNNEILSERSDCNWFLQRLHHLEHNSHFASSCPVGWDFCSHGGDDRTDGEAACSGTAVGVRRVSVQLTCTRQLLVTGSCALQRFHSWSITVSPAAGIRVDFYNRGGVFHIKDSSALLKLIIYIVKHNLHPSRIILELRILHGSDTVACSRTALHRWEQCVYFMHVLKFDTYIDCHKLFSCFFFLFDRNGEIFQFPSRMINSDRWSHHLYVLRNAQINKDEMKQ